MPDKVAIELSPYMSPDSLRKTTQMLKSLYDGHTKKYYGCKDINDSQYIGTVENFGSELLLESRKILLDRPALKDIFIKNTFDYYFDIQYSEIINSYEQENMLCAILKKDVLLSNKEYRIKFNNVEKVYIVRSESYGDTITHPDPYIKTTVPPSLIIKNNDATYEEIELKLSDDSGAHTDYYFHIGSDTEGMYEEYNDEDNTFLTKPISNKMNGLPLVWMCVNNLKTHTWVSFHGNPGNNDSKPLLTVGSNGNDESYIYPYMYGTESFQNKISCSGWIMCAIAADDDGFIENDNSELNFNTKLKEIRFDYYSDIAGLREPDFSKKPTASFTIVWDDLYIKLTLANDPRFKWKFRKCIEGDYHYDGRTYNNKCYAYTHLVYFSNNYYPLHLKKYGCLAAFKVHFNDLYVYKYKSDSRNAVAGLHVDVTSDHSDNGISKKNGTIHNLGDFDGLPKYFKYMIDDTIHRAHVELYAVRDNMNGRNQKFTEKQTVGILIDSAIPQTEIQKITLDMRTDIKYNYHDQTQYLYETVNEPLTTSNILSEIVYVDNNTMANSNMLKYANKNKFLYHGNRFFSLNMIGFNPELEMGRVYIISNDESIYENNDITNNRKPDRTFARICDIPTKFSQLINIDNHAPTLIIDKYYTRTGTNFTEHEKNIIWNKTNLSHCLILKNEENGLPVLIAPPMIDIKYLIPENYLYDNYTKYYNLNQKIDLNDDSVCQLSIGSGGNNYSVGERFSFLIGGVSIDGNVVSVGDDGNVTDINIDYNRYPINLSNFSNKYSVYNTNTIIGKGEGLTVVIEIDKDFWNSKMLRRDIPYDDLFAFKFDNVNNIWVWELINGDWVKTTQITGIHQEYNGYNNIAIYSLKDSLIHYIISYHDKSLIHYTKNSNVTISNISKQMIDIDDNIDLSQYINDKLINKQGCFYVIKDDKDISEDYYIIKSYEQSTDNNDSEIILPTQHKLNVSSYVNKTNRIFYELSEDQPNLFMYNPLMNFKYISSIICKDMNNINKKQEISINEIIQDSDVITKRGYIMSNIYAYDEFPFSDIEKIREEFDSMTDDNLMSYIIKNHYQTSASKYNNTKYSYSHDMLVDYIMVNKLYMFAKNNTTNHTIYERQGIKLKYKKDTNISDYDCSIGNYEPITTTMFNPIGYINKRNIEFSPLFIFKLDGECGNLKNFRMRDDMDNDISDMTLLIYNNEPMVFVSNNDGSCKWVKIKR